MQTRVLLVFLAIGILAACTSNQPTQTPSPDPTQTSIPTVTLEPATPEATPTANPAVLPTEKVAAFYYPWYANPQTDGKWTHWAQNNHLPPTDLGSDYFPVLGAYSSNDPAIIEQHMKWLKQAGVGVIITSWWGQGTREDRPVPLLLETAERHGIKVAFHIEPYNKRTAASLVSDIQYLYAKYGNSPAFFRSTATSRYSPDDKPKGMFFLWSIEAKGEARYSYWQEAIDQIHALPEGALVIAHTLDTAWIEGSHFDGLYNYASLHLEQGSFDWARSLPPDTLYIPSVIPGFSARRVAYPDDTFVDRKDGKTYDEQWTAALGTSVEPEMVTITSFNEWHEGSIIEPAQVGATDGNGNTYADFGALPPEGYLDLTRDWINKYLGMNWSSTYRARIKVVTTSDWTSVDVLGGGAWLRPERVSASDSAAFAGMEYGDRFLLSQSLEAAGAGTQVEMVWDVLLTDLTPDQDLLLQIDRGSIGETQVTIYNYVGETPVEIETFESNQATIDRNNYQVTVPVEKLTDSNF